MQDSSTVDGRNSEEHETHVVDSTTVGFKSCCCCSNSKIAKKSNEESEVEYSPPLGIGFSFVVIYRSPIKQTGFRCWSTPGLPSILLIRS